MTHQEGQPEELVLSKAEHETIEEDLLDAVTGGGLKDFFRCCFNPQTQVTTAQPSSPVASNHSSSPVASNHSSLSGIEITHPNENRDLTRAEVISLYPEESSSLGRQNSVVFPRNPHLPPQGR